MNSIEQTIQEAALETHFAATSGDCGSIAAALNDRYGGTILVINSEPYTDAAAHVALEHNGVVFDGTGRTTRAALVEEYARDDVTEPVSAYIDEYPRVPETMVKRDVKQAVELTLDSVEGGL